ncbi:T9SS type A sorting domain-containing protein [Tenacibaculum sp. SG-28]|uniref:T9SS type A sorting domain-containing protein n=1 Tax=Tenacibaculum sp. SG-28 TaxID=754426 RepID=UPI000CF440B5|nr:T9SS type A sorting domain-containing protein [Tenacibaculum sp. SG-28]PQJ21556.1 hypothetical protein BSU00_05435 [Tenacibaculum sp. SG-28]
MKKTITLFLLMLSVSLVAQIQSNLPWALNTNDSNSSKKNKTTLKDYTTNAEKYFENINREAKGSGFKPFKRWENHWSYYQNEDGTLSTAEDLWKAWTAKQNLGQRNENTSDWKPLGPYQNSNTHNAINFKQTGGGRINAIAVDPSDSNTIYIGSPAGGIWKSIDGGLNWKPLTDYLPQIGVSGIAVHPTNSDIIYIATGDDDANDSFSVGVWKSEDGGNSWERTGAMIGNPNSMNEIYINPDATETVIVATSAGVFKTNDGGDTWSRKLAANIVDIKMKPNDPSVWYALSDTKFYKSTNGGNSFTEKSITGLGNSTRMTMDVTLANEEYIYIVSAGVNSRFNGIYKSTDSGESFTRTSERDDIFNSSQAWYDLAITVSSDDADIIYVGVLDIWKSTDGGNNFSELNQWYDPNTADYTHADIHFLRFIDGRFFAGTDGGIFVSEDEGTNFTDLSKNLSIHQFYRISVSQNKLDALAAGAQDNGGYGLSESNWYNYHGGDGMEGVVDVNNPNIYYGFTQYGGSLNITQDGGLTRPIRINRPSREGNGRWITPLTMNSSGELYSGYSQLYRLQNNNWVRVSNTNVIGGLLDHIEIDKNDDDFILVSSGNRLSISTNKGATFSTVPFSNGTIRSIEISNTESDVVWIVTNNAVFKTTDIKSSSPTFENITGNLPSEGKVVIKHHARSGNNTVYLGTNLGVYYTNDDLNGEWITFDNNLPNTQVADMDINEEDGKLYAGTYGRGVFSTDIPYQKPEKDIRLLSIVNPDSNSILINGEISPKVKVKNQGIETITQVTIEYNYDGGDVQTESWTGSLATDQEIEIEIPSGNLNVGVHDLNVSTSTQNDAYASNNSGKVNFYVNKTSSNPTEINSFENSEDLLLTRNDMWELGSVNKALLKTPTGNNAYATKLIGNHPDATNGYLYTNYYNLTDVSNPVLRFKMGFDIEENWDHMYVDYSTDRGNTWTILGTANDANWYNSSATLSPQGQPVLPGKQWTGEGEDENPLGDTNATIHDYSYDLSALSNQTEIMFRFVFVADANTNEEGVVIDDLVIEGVLSNNDLELLNGISVSPNPSESIFNIQWQPDGEPMDLTIYDITGKKILSRKDIDTASFSIDMTKYTSGIYLLNMKSKGKSATKKLVLK